MRKNCLSRYIWVGLFVFFMMMVMGCNPNPVAVTETPPNEPQDVSSAKQEEIDLAGKLSEKISILTELAKKGLDAAQEGETIVYNPNLSVKKTGNLYHMVLTDVHVGDKIGTKGINNSAYVNGVIDMTQNADDSFNMDVEVTGDCSIASSLVYKESESAIGDNSFQDFFECLSIKYDGQDVEKKELVTNILNKESALGNLNSYSISPEGVLTMKESAKDSFFVIVVPSELDGIKVKTLGMNCFSDCKNLTAAYIAEGVEVLEEYSFHRCYKLEDVSIPSTVRIMRDFALSDTAITEFPISKNVEYITGKSFEGNSKMTHFSVDPENQYYTVKDGVLFSKDEKTLVSYPAGRFTPKYTIPSGTEVLGRSSFAWTRAAITELEMPDTLKRIEESAFWDCGVSCYYIPASVEFIGQAVWGNNHNTEILSVAEENTHYKSIENVIYTEDGKTLLRAAEKKRGSFDIPTGVEAIAPYAFRGSSLSEIIIPNTVTRIGGLAFYNSFSIETITIPASVQVMGYIINSSISNTGRIIYSNGFDDVFDSNYSLTDVYMQCMISDDNGGINSPWGIESGITIHDEIELHDTSSVAWSYDLSKHYKKCEYCGLQTQGSHIDNNNNEIKLFGTCSVCGVNPIVGRWIPVVDPSFGSYVFNLESYGNSTVSFDCIDPSKNFVKNFNAIKVDSNTITLGNTPNDLAGHSASIGHDESNSKTVTFAIINMAWGSDIVMTNNGSSDFEGTYTGSLDGYDLKLELSEPQGGIGTFTITPNNNDNHDFDANGMYKIISDELMYMYYESNGNINKSSENSLTYNSKIFTKDSTSGKYVNDDKSEAIDIDEAKGEVSFEGLTPFGLGYDVRIDTCFFRKDDNSYILSEYKQNAEAVQLPYEINSENPNQIYIGEGEFRTLFRMD